MDKYTPGPWTVYNRKAVHAGPFAILLSCDRGENDETYLANAKLIAAAPRMLEQLRSAERWLRVYIYHDSPEQSSMTALANEIKKVIDEATK